MITAPKKGKTLVAGIHWARLFNVLKLSVPNQVLPAILDCPFCRRKTLYVREDKIYGGQRFYCNSCGSAGDMLQFACKLWQLPTAAAVRKLAHLGLPVLAARSDGQTELAQYTGQLNRSQEFAKFWSEISALPTLRQGSRILNLMVPRLIQLVDRREQLRLLGITSVSALRDLLPICRKLLPGKKDGWDDVVVLPLQDFPDRWRALVVVGNKARFPDDFRLVPIAPEVGDCGLYFQQALLTTNEPIVAFSNPVRHIRLQARSLRIYQKALPLLSWYESAPYRSQHAWQLFSGRRIVLWQELLTPGVLWQAIKTDAEISIIGTLAQDPAQLTKFFTNTSPSSVTAYILQHGRHWSEVLQSTTQKWSDNTLEELLLNLRLTDEQLFNVIAACERKFQRRLKKILLRDTPGNRSQLVMGGKLVEVRNDGWFCLQGGHEELISSGRLKITRVVRNVGIGGKTYYEGSVHLGQKRINFCEAKTVVEADTFDWMQELLIKHNLGVMRYTPGWSRKAVSIAMKLFPPELVTGLARVGWHAPAAGYNFPRFTLRFGRKQPKVCTRLISTAPGGDVPVPSEITSGDFAELLADTPQAIAFWAAWLAATYNIVAPSVNMPSRGIAVAGELAGAAVRSITSAFGLQTYSLVTDKPEQILAAEYEHNYPIAVDFTSRASLLRIRNYATLTSDPRNCLLRTSTSQANVLAMTANWISFVDEQLLLVPSLFEDLGRPLLPNFLLWLLTHANHELGEQRPFFQRVVAAAKRWLVSLHYTGDIIERAAERLKTGDCAELLLDTLAALHRQGAFTVLPETFSTEYNTCWHTMNPAGIFIPQQLVSQLLERNYAPRVDHLALTELLRSSGALVGTTTVNRLAGWIVSEKAWAAAVRSPQAIQTSGLRVRVS